MGSVRTASPSSAMLATMAVTVATDAHSLVKPSVYFKPIAQATSSSPAASNISHAMRVLRMGQGRPCGWMETGGRPPGGSALGAVVAMAVGRFPLAAGVVASQHLVLMRLMHGQHGQRLQVR